jgi:hypothetical protein
LESFVLDTPFVAVVVLDNFVVVLVDISIQQPNSQTAKQPNSQTAKQPNSQTATANKQTAVVSDCRQTAVNSQKVSEK